MTKPCTHIVIWGQPWVLPVKGKSIVVDCEFKNRTRLQRRLSAVLTTRAGPGAFRTKQVMRGVEVERVR